MSNQAKQWGAIIVMIALFAMIAFVTNLCTPMATIIKNQGEISNVLAQIGNYGNFVAYLVMGIPAGMLIAKFGYKKTALIGLVVGAVGFLFAEPFVRFLAPGATEQAIIRHYLYSCLRCFLSLNAYIPRYR